MLEKAVALKELSKYAMDLFFSYIKTTISVEGNGMCGALFFINELVCQNNQI